MKHLDKLVIVLFVMVLVCFCGVEAYDHLLVDHTPPVIHCDSGLLELSVYDGEAALLQGVTASDGRDGDLTTHVMLNGVTGLLADNTAKVTYIVFDAAGNMATCTRRICYTDYELPQFSLTRPLVYAVGKTVTLTDRLYASDILDGDISDKIRVTAQDINTKYEGPYTITVQVTNSMGDTASLPLTVLVSNSGASSQTVTLTKYIVYLDIGSSFNPESYVANVKNGSYSALQVNSNVNTNVAGNYEVSYTYSSGGTSYTAYLAVVVG